MNQRIVVMTAAAILSFLTTTVVVTLVGTSSLMAFAQNVDNEGVEEDDDDVTKETNDTINIDNALAKYKDSIICALNRHSSDCEQESQAGIETEEEEEGEEEEGLSHA
jgi:formyltetrahydrofolate synthetase